MLRIPAIAFAGGVSIWALLRLFGLDAWYPAVQLMAFTPYAAVIAAVGVPILGVWRKWPELAVTAVSAAILASCVLPRAMTDGDALAGATGPVLRVASANLMLGWADPEEIVAKVRAENIDVLAVQEMPPEWLAKADAAGLRELLPQRSVAPVEGSQGSGVFSRLPLSDGGSQRLDENWFEQAHATVTISGVPVRIESAHPASPYGRRVIPDWRDQLRDEPAATPDGQLSVLVGDFNSTLDHGLLRDLVDRGYRDAASVVGKGLVGTWGPYNKQPIPPVTIDHVLADRRIGVRTFAAYQITGTDHRMIVSTLVLPTS